MELISSTGVYSSIGFMLFSTMRHRSLGLPTLHILTATQIILCRRVVALRSYTELLVSAVLQFIMFPTLIILEVSICLSNDDTAEYY